MPEPVSRSLPALPSTQWLEPLPPAARFAFYGGAAARAAARSAWGAAFSEASCRAERQDRCATLWLGPDEYLLLEAGGDGAARFTELERALTDVPHALVDISHRQLGFEVRGPHAATILNGACPLDLDGAEFPPGMCTRTVLAKADIVLWRTDEEVFHLEVWRSFTGYVTGVLSEIAAEFYPSPDAKT